MSNSFYWFRLIKMLFLLQAIVIISALESPLAVSISGISLDASVEAFKE